MFQPMVGWLFWVCGAQHHGKEHVVGELLTSWQLEMRDGEREETSIPISPSRAHLQWSDFFHEAPPGKDSTISGSVIG